MQILGAAVFGLGKNLYTRVIFAVFYSLVAVCTIKFTSAGFGGFGGFGGYGGLGGYGSPLGLGFGLWGGYPGFGFPWLSPPLGYQINTGELRLP